MKTVSLYRVKNANCFIKRYQKGNLLQTVTFFDELDFPSHSKGLGGFCD
jgi:hypothetical protein